MRTRKETAPRSTTSEGWGGQKEEEENPLSPHPQPPGKFPLFPSLSSHLVHRLEPPGVVVRVRHEVDVELALGAVRSSFEVGKRGRGGEKSWVSVVGGGCFGQGGDDDPSKLERARFAPFRSTLLLDSNLQCVSSPFRGRVVDGRDACMLARVVVAARATMVSMLLALMAEIAPPVASSLQEAKRRERRSLFRRQLQRALRGARCARREDPFAPLRRRRWLDFLATYMASRPELKVVVHLVDSQAAARVGAPVPPRRSRHRIQNTATCGSLGASFGAPPAPPSGSCGCVRLVLGGPGGLARSAARRTCAKVCIQDTATRLLRWASRTRTRRS